MRLITLPVVYKRVLIDKINMENAPDGSYNSVLKELGIDENNEEEELTEDDFTEDLTVDTYVDAEVFTMPHIKGYINTDGSIEEHKCTIEFGPFGTRVTIVVDLSAEDLIQRLYGLSIRELG